MKKPKRSQITTAQHHLSLAKDNNRMNNCLCHACFIVRAWMRRSLTPA